MSIVPVLLEYIWIDGSNNLRSKNRVVFVEREVSGPEYFLDSNLNENIQMWNFDGSSTGQADVGCSEVILKPVKIFIDPFLSTPQSSVQTVPVSTSQNFVRTVPKGDVTTLLSTNHDHLMQNNSTQMAYLVLCETYSMDLKPHKTNTRNAANEIFTKYLDEHPWYGIEQEFFLMDRKTRLPVGFGYTNSKNEYCSPEPQGQYYCGVGSQNVYEREYILDVYRAALKAGLKISGLNAEVAPGQWEIQVGPCEGVDAGDQLWILRYIMHRLTEGKDFYVELHAKPIGNKPAQDVEGSWNGSGAHCNFSTKKMREEGGIDRIYNAIAKLETKHMEHIQLYGVDNSLRMTGKHETSDINKFSYSLGGRNVSIRIPFQVNQNMKGYLEDRRPSSSCDPYVVTSKLLDTIMG